MKILLAVALVLCLACSVGYADKTGSATALVYVTVNPNITIAPVTGIVNAGTVQTGIFDAAITYRVDANVEQLCFFVEVSPLFKGDDPNSEVPPIPIDLSEGVAILPANANPLAGGCDIADYIGAGAVVEGFPTSLTETLYFESSQSGHFSQDVVVLASWNQDNPEKPMGEYSGIVRLTAMVKPFTVDPAK